MQRMPRRVEEEIPMTKRFDKAKYHLPTNHQPAIEVPRGGSMCANCTLYSPKGGQHGSCSAPEYKIYYGTKLLPLPPDRFCSDWYEPIKSELG
jgi:hypothetical protein